MNMLDSAVLIVHLFATAAMVGLIWFVQVVHYPLFAAVGADGFAAYEARHQTLTSFVVGPPMALEGVTALWLTFDPPAAVGRGWPLLGLFVLGVVHASTVFLQVPQHTVLSHGFDAGRARTLVRTNWIRTAGWTTRGIIAAVMVSQALTH
jgi:hypothetical protein